MLYCFLVRFIDLINDHTQRRLRTLQFFEHIAFVVFLVNVGHQQDQVGIYKDPSGIIYYLPPALIKNSYAAFELNGQSLTTLDPNAPYIGPPTTPGQMGNVVFLYNPWLERFDLSLVKKTSVGEGKSIEFRCNALNAFNLTNFFLTPNGFGTLAVNSTLFGQTRNAYKDLNSTNDPGSRVIEFGLRFTF